MKKDNFKNKFNACCSSARDGLGGAIVSHIGCLSAPLIAGAFGVGLSGTFMAATMYTLSPIVAMGAAYAMARHRKQKVTFGKLLGSAAFAVGLSFALMQFTGHDHENHTDHGQTHNAITTKQATDWFNRQSDQMRTTILQASKDLGVSYTQYITDQMCITVDDLETRKTLNNQNSLKLVR